MTRHTLWRTVAGFTLAGMTLAAAPWAQGAHAQGAIPSITAIADNAIFGVVEVSGQNFDSGDFISIRVINPSTGALIQTVSTGSGSAGFTKTFSISGACGLASVELQAVDNNTLETSAPITLTLTSPLTLASNRLQAAEGALASAIGSQPAVGNAETWLTYFQQIAASQAAVIAGQDQLYAAQSGACS